jgi:transposase
MIVIGVDVHKHSLTAVAVDEVGRTLSQWTGPLGGKVLAWARSLAPERLWALEDCRHVSRGLEQLLQAGSERLVRVPPRLTAPQRRRGRTRGKSDAIDALAVARAALRELDRALWLERLGRRLARREQTTQVRIARELLGRCRSLSRSIAELERELQERTQTIAPRLLELAGCGALSAAKLLCEIGPIERFGSDAQLARHAGVAPLEASSGKQRRHRLDRGGNRQLNCALHRIAVTQGRVHAPARAYLERKQSEGKSRREALRCLKRQLARTVYTTLKSEPLLT